MRLLSRGQFGIEKKRKQYKKGGPEGIRRSLTSDRVCVIMPLSSSLLHHNTTHSTLPGERSRRHRLLDSGGHQRPQEQGVRSILRAKFLSPRNHPVSSPTQPSYVRRFCRSISQHSSSQPRSLFNDIRFFPRHHALEH